MRGAIREGNGDAPMVEQRNGKWGTFIEKLSNFLAGIRSSVRDDPARGGKERKREANRLSQWSDGPQGDEIVSADVARIVGKLLGAGVEDRQMGTGELSDHLSEKQRPLAPRFEENDVQIRTKNLKRNAWKACPGTDVKKGENLL